MARLVLSVLSIMLFGAVLGVSGMLPNVVNFHGPSPYSYTYLEETEGDNHPMHLVPNAYAHQELVDSNKMLPFEIRRDVSTTPTPYVGSPDGAMRQPSLGRAKRAAYYYPYYLHWLPHPTRESHYVYDSYLGKVKREAPTPLVYNTKFTAH